MASVRLGVLLLLGMICVRAAFAAESPAPPKAKVEFHWLEDRPIPGVTEEKGIHTSETDELSYPHLKPILTNEDITSVRVTTTKFGVGATASEQYLLDFQLTKEARQKLAESCGPTGDKTLAAMIDGGYHGCPYYLKSRDETTFAPFAGYFSSKEQVDRVVATINKRGDRAKP
jgi:hypothetical protein